MEKDFFDVFPHLKVKKELEELFSSLCKEFGTTENSINYVEMAATDDSEESLIERGY